MLGLTRIGRAQKACGLSTLGLDVNYSARNWRRETPPDGKDGEMVCDRIDYRFALSKVGHRASVLGKSDGKRCPARWRGVGYLRPGGNPASKILLRAPSIS